MPEKEPLKKHSKKARGKHPSIKPVHSCTKSNISGKENMAQKCKTGDCNWSIKGAERRVEVHHCQAEKQTCPKFETLPGL